MTDPILLTGLTPTWRVPSILIQIGFNANSTGGGAADRTNVIVMPKLPSGTYTANTLYYPANGAEVDAGAGAKSAAARAWKFFKRVAPGVKVGVITYAETSGGSPVKATTTIVVAGTSTAQVTWTLDIAGEQTSVLIPTGTAAADVAALMRSALGASKVIDVSGSSANVIVTAPHYGIRGGVAAHPTIRIWSSTPGSGITITCPAYVGATTPGAEGTTTEAANYAAALNANSGTWIYNIITDQACNATLITNSNAFMLNQSLPLSGKRGTTISAYAGGLTAGTTLALAQNYERYSVAWTYAFKNAPDEAVAQFAALLAKYEAADRTYNFDNYSGPDMLLTPVEDSTLFPDANDANDAIIGGMTPFGVAANGKGILVKATTTKVRDATGVYYLWGAYERHRVSGADDCGDQMQSMLAIAAAGQKLADDPVDINGKPVFNRKRPRGVVYPYTIRPKVVAKLRQLEEGAQSQRTEEAIASLQVLRSTENRGRVLVSFNYYTIDLFDQAAVFIAESTPG